MLTRLFLFCSVFYSREEGATVIEYAFIAAGIAMTIAATLFLLGATLDGAYTSVDDIFN